jgi:ferritin-like metal-binding protein YciE
MKLNELRDLFVDELRDLYSAETQLVKALPKMAKAASTPELREAIQHHLGETEEHVRRLEQIFDKLGAKPKGKKCKPIESMIEEGKEAIENAEEEATRDAAIICGGQKVEHYEMASYGCVRTWAQQLGEEDAAELLQQTLDEEGAADKKLTEIAESAVNQDAATAAS